MIPINSIIDKTQGGGGPRGAGGSHTIQHKESAIILSDENLKNKIKE